MISERFLSPFVCSHPHSPLTVLQLLAEHHHQGIKLATTQISLGRSLDSNWVRLSTPALTDYNLLFKLFPFASTAHLSSSISVQELIPVCYIACTLEHTASLCPFSPQILNSHWYLNSVCLQLQEKYVIPSVQTTPARDLQHS